MAIMPVSFPAFPVAGVGGLATTSPTSIAPANGVVSTGSTNGVSGAEFGELVLDGLDKLEGLTDRADNLAVGAATGKLENIHDYTIAASEASVATQLTVALRNKAVEAFNEILRMQV